IDDDAERRRHSQRAYFEILLLHRLSPRSDSLSKSQSPMTLTDAAVRTSAMPGPRAVHALSNSSVLLSESILPQSAAPGPTPRPRNDNAARETMLNANVRNALATASGKTFGQTCRKMMRRCGMSAIRAASTYGWPR